VPGLWGSRARVQILLPALSEYETLTKPLNLPCLSFLICKMGTVVVQSSFSIQGGLVVGPPVVMEVRGHSSPLYKMSYYLHRIYIHL
jgi:hypothetical protein